MAREDWRDHPDYRGQPLRDGPLDRQSLDPRAGDRRDFGQADYSTEYAYDARSRTGYRPGDRAAAGMNDYGQADYSTDYAIDPETGRAYRRAVADAPAERRSFGSKERSRKGPSDRVLWAVIMERLEDARRLDLSNVQVSVQNGEVTLNGAVRHKEDKRRIEDIADIDGVRNVQNNLRPRDRGWF